MSQKKTEMQRRHEIDLLRAVAVILMIIYHFLFDLQTFFEISNLNLQAGILWFIGRSAAFLFFFIFGVSGVLSFLRYGISWKKAFLRFGLLLFWGMVITIITLIILPDRLILFGVLHFLAVSALLMPLFFRLHPVFLIASVFACFAIGYRFAHIDVQLLALLPFGIHPRSFVSLDYYPIFPWFGVILLGVFFGKILYEMHPPKWQLLYFFGREPLLLIGRHALMIYVLHQPVLLLLAFWTYYLFWYDGYVFFYVFF